jgi:hypothetical protein
MRKGFCMEDREMKDSEEFRIHYTPGEKRAIISMFRAGMKLDVLLDEYGVLPQTLVAWMKEFQCEKERVSLTLIGWIFGAKT